MERFCRPLPKVDPRKQFYTAINANRCAKTGYRKVPPERRATAGPRWTRCSRIGAPGSQPPETEKAQVGESTGDGRGLQRERRKKREECQALYPLGKRLPVVEGLALVWEVIACMSWKEPVFGAQDKDVRPDKESSC